jgi:Zn-dependent protease
MLDFSLPQKIAIWALPVLFAITVHEVAHGFVASRLGDRTAQMMGRLTLNPLKHIDPVGTVLVPLAMLLLPGGILFGWAKPVPIGYRNLGNPKRDMAIVAAAGPLSNLLMAVGWALLLRLSVELLHTLPWAAQPLFFMAQAGIANLILMILNLVPVPPLDGGRVLTGLLPARQAAALGAIEPYGLMIVVALLLTGVLWRILQPVIQLFNELLLVMVGLGGSA